MDSYFRCVIWSYPQFYNKIMLPLCKFPPLWQIYDFVVFLIKKIAFLKVKFNVFYCALTTIFMTIWQVWSFLVELDVIWTIDFVSVTLVTTHYGLTREQYKIIINMSSLRKLNALCWTISFAMVVVVSLPLVVDVPVHMALVMPLPLPLLHVVVASSQVCITTCWCNHTSPLCLNI